MQIKTESKELKLDSYQYEYLNSRGKFLNYISENLPPYYHQMISQSIYKDPANLIVKIYLTYEICVPDPEYATDYA